MEQNKKLQRLLHDYGSDEDFSRLLKDKIERKNMSWERIDAAMPPDDPHFYRSVILRPKVYRSKDGILRSAPITRDYGPLAFPDDRRRSEMMNQSGSSYTDLMPDADIRARRVAFKAATPWRRQEQKEIRERDNKFQREKIKDEFFYQRKKARKAALPLDPKAPKAKNFEAKAKSYEEQMNEFRRKVLNDEFEGIWDDADSFKESAEEKAKQSNFKNENKGFNDKFDDAFQKAKSGANTAGEAENVLSGASKWKKYLPHMAGGLAAGVSLGALMALAKKSDNESQGKRKLKRLLAEGG